MGLGLGRRMLVALSLCAFGCGEDEPIRALDIGDDAGRTPDADSGHVDARSERDGGTGGTPNEGGRDAAIDREEGGGPDADAEPPDAGFVCPEPDPPPSAPGSCGDGFRNAETEECDDGAAASGDRCTDECRVSDALVAPPAGTASNPVARRLGNGNHVVAAVCRGFGVVYASDGAERGVEHAFFDQRGVFQSSVVVAANASAAVPPSDPVLAGIMGERFAIAWNDFGGDGDQLGIALRLVEPGVAPAGTHGFANAGKAFSQSNPDIVATRHEVVVAWSDDAVFETGPDIRFRRFDHALMPLGDDETLAAGRARESAVVLATFGTGWAAAWRASENGSETTHVHAAGLEWQTAEHAASPSRSKPALLELDATHLLLVFTADRELRFAVLSTDAPGSVESYPIPAGTSQACSEPTLARAGDRVFLAFRTEAVTGSADGDELWLKEMSLVANGAELTLDLSGPEISLPRAGAQRLGDQRGARIAAVSPAPQPALAALWEDFGRTLGPGQGGPDVFVGLMPVPALRLDDGSPLEP